MHPFADSIVPPGEASYSHLASVRLPPAATGVLIHNGPTDVKHYGYVRSASAMKRSRRAELGEQIDKLPFRDYPESFRTPVTQIHSQALAALQTDSAIVITARNVDNEIGFQARQSGRWHRRADDHDVPQHFPVLRVPRNEPLSFCSFAEARDTGDDLLLGLPLVINRGAVRREFIVANASDVAWVYAVDPDGKFGPPPPAWAKLSNRWQELRDLKLSDDEIASEMDGIARQENERGRRLGRQTIDPPNAHALPHSVLAWRNGAVHAIVASGTLWAIATYLETHRFESAFLLDQSGSTRYSFLSGGKALPIVGTSNWRDSGTCFLAVKTGAWLWPAPHFAL